MVRGAGGTSEHIDDPYVKSSDSTHSFPLSISGEVHIKSPSHSQTSDSQIAYDNI